MSAATAHFTVWLLPEIQVCLSVYIMLSNVLVPPASSWDAWDNLLWKETIGTAALTLRLI